MTASIRRGKFPSAAVFALLAAALTFGCYVLRYDFRSYALLIRYIRPNASGPLLWWETRAVSVQEVSLPTATGGVRARLYLPANTAHAPGVVVVHGLNELGMDDPRLMNFARAAASTGFAVLTPQLTTLADYHFDEASIDAIGESAQWLQRRQARGPVATIGISVGGGLSLVAASEAQYAPAFRVVAALGAFDDLARVSRFLATGQAELPDGRNIPYAVDDYGVAVLAYDNVAQLFSSSDVQAARQGLRDWMAGRARNAQQGVVQLSPTGRATMQAVLSGQIGALRPTLLDAIRANASALAAVSPHGRFATLRAPVFLLHGSEDHVIPYTETLWLAQEVPSQDLRRVLITSFFAHADPETGASFPEKVRLIRFIAGVLRAAN